MVYSMLVHGLTTQDKSRREVSTFQDEIVHDFAFKGATLYRIKE